MNQTLRFPAEWEAQSGVLIAWPTADTDWADRLGQVEETYIALVAAITRFQPVLICVADDDVETYAEMRLRSNRIDMDKVHFTTAAYDDTWLRDSGPITLRRADGGFQLLDFRFTGWGGKFDATLDDQLVGVLDHAGVFNDAPVRSIPFALEGGGIETDGEGTLLTTATWKATTPTRTSTPSPASPRPTASSTRPVTTRATRTSPNCRRWATSWPHCAPRMGSRTACSRCRGHSR